MAAKQKTPPLVPPAAAKISDLVRKLEDLTQKRDEAYRRLDNEFSKKIRETQANLDAAMAALAKKTEEPKRRSRPKRRWREIAEAIEHDPSAGYPEICKVVHGKIVEANIRTLRVQISQMRAASVLDGEPGAWRLLKPLHEIGTAAWAVAWTEDHDPEAQEALQYRNLVGEINQLRRNYYAGLPEISDTEYDLKMRELVKIEHEHPDWILPDSPTQQPDKKPKRKGNK